MHSVSLSLEASLLLLVDPSLHLDALLLVPQSLSLLLVLSQLLELFVRLLHSGLEARVESKVLHRLVPD